MAIYIGSESNRPFYDPLVAVFLDGRSADPCQKAVVLAGTSSFGASSAVAQSKQRLSVRSTAGVLNLARSDAAFDSEKEIP